MSMIEKFVNKFKKEGIDHIRISPYADTVIGKLASADWRKKFFIPHVGEFSTPVCFANWLSTGDDDARHNTRFRYNSTVRGYRTFILYAKFYQLCSMKMSLEREMSDLPFAAYKQHQSGIKEFDRWKEYPSEVKDMIAHIIDPARGPKVPYPWEEKHPGLIARIGEHIAAIAGEAAENEELEKEAVEADVEVDSSAPAVE